ncbi:MAG: serine hydrolase domain-containing protein [Flavobacteriales bacterium]
MMKKNTLVLLTMLLLCFSCSKEPHVDTDAYACNAIPADSSALHPKNAQYQALLNEICASGVPGILMAVRQPGQPLWCGASGMADLHNGVELRPCNYTRVGSTVKTYTAVSILKLQEEGKLHLDDPLGKYLDETQLKQLENAEKVSIRQLLNHSAGMYNYIQNLEFQTASTNDLIREWHADDLLAYARKKKAYFAPGEDLIYSNTHYILLGMVIEKIEGKPFYEVFDEKIFTPLGLTRTRFAAGDPVPAGIIRGYVDLYSNQNLINATYYSGWDYYTADGGLISNPADMTLFLREVCSGNLLSPASRAEMLSWKTPSQQDPAFFAMQYGLGIFRMETPWGEAWFHSGDAIGYYATMLYFPAQQTCIAWAVNGNYGKIDAFTSSKTAMEKVFGTVLN